jgi:hypothetical protein
MPDVIISATGIGGTLLACGIAIVLVIRFRRAYEKQSAATRDDETPRYAAYKKLAMAGAHLTLLVTISSLVVTVAAVLFLSAQAIYPRVFVFVGIALCIIVAPCLVLPRLLFDFLALLYVDNPALAEFQGCDLASQKVMAFSIRSIFCGHIANDRRYRAILTVSLSSLLLFEATGILLLLNFHIYLWIIPVLAVLLRLIDGLTKNFTLKWIARVEPLEKTRWAALEPRIRQFSEREEVEIGGIYVQAMARTGSAQSQVYGLRHPTLLLSDIFLKNSDWRQQDALIVIMLGYIKKNASRINIVFSLAVTVTFWIFVVAFSTLVASLDAPVAPSTALTALFSLCVFCILLMVIRVFSLSQQSAHYRSAMHVTGDPLAVLAAIHTMGLLTTTLLSSYTWRSKRMSRLHHHASQFGPRAPWADRPVPSIAPLDPGSVTLTIPLEQAPPPEPVADALYSESKPNALSIFG